MLFYILCTLGWGLAALTIWLANISPLWGILLFPLYGFLICFLELLFFMGIGLFIKEGKTPPHIRPSFYRFMLFYSSNIMIRLLRVRIHVVGKEKIPKDKKQALMFVSNHLSHFDPFVHSTLFYDRNVVFVTKPENTQIPMYGRYISAAGFIPIDRVSPMQAMRAINLAAKRMKEDNCAVGIYPEGTISLSTALLGFHEGVFLAAKKANAPILVTTLTGTDRVKRNWYRFGTDVYVNIIDLIDAEEVAQLRTGELSYKVREMMRPSLIKAGYGAPPTEEAEVADLHLLQKQPAPQKESEI